MRRSFILVAFLFSACATNFRVAGPYARSLSEADITELKRLVEGDHYHSVTITAIAADRVSMWAVRTVGNETRHRALDALRRNGKWSLVKRPAGPPAQKLLLPFLAAQKDLTMRWSEQRTAVRPHFR
jgi:hypothetical protein